MPWNVIEVNTEGEWYVVKTCNTHEEAEDFATREQERCESDYLVEEVK